MLLLASRFFWFTVAIKIIVEISFCMCIYTEFPWISWLGMEFLDFKNVFVFKFEIKLTCFPKYV